MSRPEHVVPHSFDFDPHDIDDEHLSRYLAKCRDIAQANYIERPSYETWYHFRMMDAAASRYCEATSRAD